MADYVVMVCAPELEGCWWWFSVRADGEKRYGPFTTEADARAERERVFARWNRAARRRGGWMWKSTHLRWHLTLPEVVRVRAPRMANTPCSVHASTLRGVSKSPEDV